MSRGRRYKEFENLPDGYVWIPGYEKYYAINRESKIIGMSTKDDIVEVAQHSLMDNKRGSKRYFTVGLSVKGVQNQFYVHRLVATIFVPNPDNKPQVNHIDGDRFNNIPENLEWVTPRENRIHAYENGLQDASIDRTAKKFISGEFDSEIMESIKSGKLVNITPYQRNKCPTEVLNRLGVSEAIFKSLCAGGVKKNGIYPREQLIEMNKTMSMTAIAKLTGYSLSAISRRINGSRK